MPQELPEVDDEADKDDVGREEVVEVVPDTRSGFAEGVWDGE